MIPKKIRISEQIIEHLERLRDEEIPVMVEGRKDKAALQELGLQLILVLYQKPFYKVIESLQQFPEIAILTDLDREGKKLYAKIKDACSQRGIRVNDKLRLFLMKETPLSQIEGLPRYLETVRRKEREKYPKVYKYREKISPKI